MSTTDEGSRVSYQGAPLFQMISAPILNGNGIEVVKKFLLARRKYEAQVKERQAQPGGADLQEQSLVLSLDPEFLDNLLFIRTF